LWDKLPVYLFRIMGEMPVAPTIRKVKAKIASSRLSEYLRESLQKKLRRLLDDNLTPARDQTLFVRLALP